MMAAAKRGLPLTCSGAKGFCVSETHSYGLQLLGTINGGVSNTLRAMNNHDTDKHFGC